MLRKWLAVANVLLVATTSSNFAQAHREPLRLGFLTVRTGVLAGGGRQMEGGIQLFLKERNNTFAGRKVELLIADTGGNPAGAKTKTQELVEHNKVHVIIGPLATFEALAIDDYIKEARVPLITPTHNVRLTRGPMGPIRVDEYGKPILNICIGKVERKDRALVNTIVETIPDVGQFWKYDPKAFMSSPPYSRDYPVPKNLE